MKANSKTQSDQGLKFDGAEVMSQNRSNKFRGNQWSGHSNDGRLVNAGRGPTKGNQDYDARQGAHKEPPTRGLPSSVKTKNPDYINGGAQVRGQGGVTAKCPPNADRINAGRGPRKGNQ